MRDSLGSAHSMTTPPPLRKRLRQFPLIGAAMGGIFTLRALVAVVFIAASHKPIDLPIGLLLMLYPAAGAVGGLIAAVAFPLVRWIGGAFLVGALAIMPVYVAVALLVEHSLTSDGIIGGVVAGLF